MAEQLYSVIFKGQVEAGKSVQDVQRALASSFNIDSDKLTLMFSQRTVIVKKNLSSELAAKYIEAFSRVGAIAELRPQGETTVATDTSFIATQPNNLTPQAPLTESHLSAAPIVATRPPPIRRAPPAADDTLGSALLFVLRLIIGLIISAAIASGLFFALAWFLGVLDFFPAAIQQFPLWVMERIGLRQ